MNDWESSFTEWRTEKIEWRNEIDNLKNVNEIERLEKENEHLKRTQGGAKHEVKGEIKDLVNNKVKNWRRKW